MKTKVTVVATMCCLILGCTRVQQPQTIADSTPLLETKISESRKKGKYKRITETFANKVLVERKEEVSLKDNGQIDYVFVKLFRGGEMIYDSDFYKAKNVTIRGYYHQGKIVVQEGDEDGDGFFETMILFDAKELPAEGFSKNKDGTVTQFSSEKLEKLRKSFAMLKE